MPLYEYHCEKCARTFEKLLKQQAATSACPICGEPARKGVSRFAATTACSAPSGSGFG